METGKYDADLLLELARILLTDRGLLFPQTRERFYDSPERSVKRHQWVHAANQSSGDYQPSLAIEEKGAFLRQIESFQRETLASWKIALPALDQYLHLTDLEKFKHRLSGCPESTNKQGEYVEKLDRTFQKYLAKMEPSTSLNVDTRELAIYFLCKRFMKDNRPVFSDQPGIIFRIFRSPVHRNIYKNKWNLRDTIYDACVRCPLPITAQSLKADQELFQDIVSLCAEVCAQDGMDFPQKPWEALWTCIEACVQCLPYQTADLLSVQYTFRQLLKFQELGYPVFDKWLEQKLSAESAPIYIVHWGSFVRKLHTFSDHGADAPDPWLEKISAYRRLMESPSADDSDIFPVIRPLAAKVPLNQISTVPSQAELERLVAEINEAAGGQKVPPLKGRSRKGPLAAMQSAPMRTRYMTASSTRAIDAVYTDWLLLQCVCGQAQRELMEAVYLLLFNKTTKPA